MGSEEPQWIFLIGAIRLLSVVRRPVQEDIPPVKWPPPADFTGPRKRDHRFASTSMVHRRKMGSSVALDRLNGGRRFLGDVIGDADDAGHFCCDSLGQSVQDIMG